MGSLNDQLHFILFPFMAQGHLVPMTDIGKLLAQRGVIVTIVTTPINAARIRKNLARFIETGLSIEVVELRFPCEEAGLPEGSESMDLLPSSEYFSNFFTAIKMLQEQAEELFERLMPRPSCVVSDFCLTYTATLAAKYNIPRISFHGFNCFSLLCMHMWHNNKDFQSTVASDSDYFVLPGFPGEIKFIRKQVPLVNKDVAKERTVQWVEEVLETDLASYGVIVNSFQALEAAYVEEYKKVRGGKAWCVGPVSLCNEDDLAKAERGNQSSIDGLQCLKWLDSQEPNSVVYVCLGSLCNLTTSQLKELGLGLEASKRKFIWVIRGNNRFKELENWITEDGFEERIKGSGFLIRGWAPQLLILSHPAIGGFLTHCGWNSTLEGVSAGMPLVTWPLFGEQFCNQKLVVEVLKIGVRIGVESPISVWPEEESDILVTREDVKTAVEVLMDQGQEGKARRERARELEKISRQAVKVGGSSHINITLLIKEIAQEAQKRKAV